jgi:hypothetical protein
LHQWLVRIANQPPEADGNSQHAQSIGPQGLPAGVDSPALVESEASRDQQQASAKMIHGVSLP